MKRRLTAVNSTRWKLGSYVLIFIITGAPGLAQRSCELFVKSKSCDSQGFLLAHALGASIRGMANAVVYGLQNKHNPLHRMLSKLCCRLRGTGGAGDRGLTPPLLPEVHSDSDEGRDIYIDSEVAWGKGEDMESIGAPR
jgi:hypothetical protein